MENIDISLYNILLNTFNISQDTNRNVIKEYIFIYVIVGSIYKTG